MAACLTCEQITQEEVSTLGIWPCRLNPERCLQTSQGISSLVATPLFLFFQGYNYDPLLIFKNLNLPPFQQDFELSSGAVGKWSDTPNKLMPTKERQAPERRNTETERIHPCWGCSCQRGAHRVSESLGHVQETPQQWGKQAKRK